MTDTADKTLNEMKIFLLENELNKTKDELELLRLTLFPLLWHVSPTIADYMESINYDKQGLAYVH